MVADDKNLFSTESLNEMGMIPKSEITIDVNRISSGNPLIPIFYKGFVMSFEIRFLRIVLFEMERLIRIVIGVIYNPCIPLTMKNDCTMIQMSITCNESLGQNLSPFYACILIVRKKGRDSSKISAFY
jgi:hypothetical protein